MEKIKNEFLFSYFHIFIPEISKYKVLLVPPAHGRHKEKNITPKRLVTDGRGEWGLQKKLFKGTVSYF